MRVEIERWLTGRKSLVTIPVVLVLIAGSWGWLLRLPQPDTNGAGTLRIQAQWRKLLPLRAALQNVDIEEQQTQAFSPIDLPVTGAALMDWRPIGRGGEMQLAVDWQAVPALFSWLARCGMRARTGAVAPRPYRHDALRDAGHGFLNSAGKSGSTAYPATGGGRCAVKGGVYCCFLCRCWLWNAIPSSLRSIAAERYSLANGATVGR